MSKLPCTYTITLTALPSGYAATITAWGVPDVGGYGSLWSRTLPLVGCPANSDSRYVLSVLAATLQAAMVGS